LTSGTVSVRVDRLAAGGLVERTPDPDRRRNVLVSLTPEGWS
jgi:DNA-binding MarR family transcriptional regulator